MLPCSAERVVFVLSQGTPPNGPFGKQPLRIPMFTKEQSPEIAGLTVMMGPEEFVLGMLTSPTNHVDRDRGGSQAPVVLLCVGPALKEPVTGLPISIFVHIVPYNVISPSIEPPLDDCSMVKR